MEGAKEEFRSSGLPDVAFASVAWQLCMQAKSGVQEFRLWRSTKLQEESVLYPLV
jgi:hypothetical protein